MAALARTDWLYNNNDDEDSNGCCATNSSNKECCTGSEGSGGKRNENSKEKEQPPKYHHQRQQPRQKAPSTNAHRRQQQPDTTIVKHLPNKRAMDDCVAATNARMPLPASFYPSTNFPTASSSSPPLFPVAPHPQSMAQFPTAIAFTASPFSDNAVDSEWHSPSCSKMARITAAAAMLPCCTTKLIDKVSGTKQTGVFGEKRKTAKSSQTQTHISNRT